ncbi:ATP-dependent zinc metalloprotease FtsH [Salisaeta longa]|uniref:ATP-dependent zinc metalloprotease FtsH n=1 Tax=Salisaeta longa TaxID=503170 RepID=UPI0003B3A6FB|nr:ATP-dependent zinc metalloprotease FtsH [Salisaeta longa]
MAQDKRTPPETGDTGSSSSKHPQFLIWIYVVVVLALVVHLVINWSSTSPQSIAYSTFLEYVEEGYVESVTLVNDARIEGRYTATAVAKGRVQVAPPSDGLLGDMTADNRRRFVSTKPDDHQLTQFLRTYNASAEQTKGPTVEFAARTEGNWLGTTLLWLLFFGALIALWVLFMRRMNPGQQVLNIGKNKAKLFDASEDHNVTFDDVAGLEEAKEEVVEVVDFLKNPEKFTRLGGKLPKGVLLVGPPGTGKTLMAKAVAGEAGVPFFSISGSDFVEMFVGVGASRVRDLFKNAKEKAPCIIFIDEMDAIGRSRGRNSMVGGNDERENTLNQLLVEMDGFDSDAGVIIMAATNRPDVLDSALLRPGRFDRQILVDKPDRIDREKIFRVHMAHLLLGADVDAAVLASQTPGFAGAEIANICNEAALLAARKEKDEVDMADFEQAIDRVIAGLEKKNKLISPEERTVIAYHEAGHAIVGWFLEHTDPVVKVSIVPRGLSALGYAQYLPEERYLYSTQALKDRMTMAIGGRVAEEVVFGSITTGAQNDLERITKMAYAMVVDYGMSERIGQVSFNLSGREEGEPVFDKPYSEATAEAIDEEVKRIIGDVREAAREMLTTRRDLLNTLAEALLEKEVLGPSELVAILGERPHGSYINTTGDGAVTGNEPQPTAHEEAASPEQSSTESTDSPAPTETPDEAAS